MIKSVGLKDHYKYYTETSNNAVSKKEFSYVIKQFMLFLMNKVFNGEEVRLPLGFGTIEVTGSKPRDSKKTKLISWGRTFKMWKDKPHTKEQGKVVIATNEHTDGYVFAFKWHKKGVSVKNKIFYKLEFTDTNKKKLRELLFSGKYNRFKKIN